MACVPRRIGCVVPTIDPLRGGFPKPETILSLVVRLQINCAGAGLATGNTARLPRENWPSHAESTPDRPAASKRNEVDSKLHSEGLKQSGSHSLPGCRNEAEECRWWTQTEGTANGSVGMNRAVPPCPSTGETPARSAGRQDFARAPHLCSVGSF